MVIIKSIITTFIYLSVLMIMLVGAELEFSSDTIVLFLASFPVSLFSLLYFKQNKKRWIMIVGFIATLFSIYQVEKFFTKPGVYGPCKKIYVNQLRFNLEAKENVYCDSGHRYLLQECLKGKKIVVDYKRQMLFQRVYKISIYDY